MTPASLAIIEAAFQPGDRTRAIGTWAGFTGVSAAIAPFLGGWLLEAGSWRAIFLINIPVAAVTAWVTRRHVPESRDTSASGSADWPGALAGVAALATITYAIIVLPGAGVTSPQFAVAGVLALVSSAAFVVTERVTAPCRPPRSAPTLTRRKPSPASGSPRPRRAGGSPAAACLDPGQPNRGVFLFYAVCVRRATAVRWQPAANARAKPRGVCGADAPSWAWAPESSLRSSPRW